MRLYEGKISDFNLLLIENKLTPELEHNFLTTFGKRPAEGEIRSWESSLNYINNVFTYSKLTDNWLVLEYNLPFSSSRIDVLTFGKDINKKDSILITELKQWSNKYVRQSSIEDTVEVKYAYGWKAVAHPSLQVEGYYNYLKDFVRLFEDDPKILLCGSSFCHNYSKNGSNIVLYDSQFEKYLKTYPLFSKEEVSNLSKYMLERIGHDPGEELFTRFIRSPFKPSKRLLNHVGEMIDKRQIFNLIDDQIAPYKAIMQKATALARSGKKSVIIVKGGPGTGKSVIALETMGELVKRGIEVYYATGSSAFTNTLRNLIGGKRGKNLFKYFYDFTKHGDNDVDVVICDEAHRLRKNSSDWGVPYDKKSNEPQIESLIRPARLSVFFIDEFQIVRPNEIGNVKLIKEAALRLGVKESDILEFELETQFRCSGSASYLGWIENVLQIGESDKKILEPIDKMKFEIVDDPLSLKKAIDNKNKENRNSARIVASFCWPWSEPNKDGTLVNDVVIGDFKMPWERKTAFWKWATQDEGMEEIGTVYTSQGFEFDYIGVIFGEDLIYDSESKSWKSNSNKLFDSMLKRNNLNLINHLKNVYRVLLTRAHKGVYVYFLDKNTKELFRSRIKQNN